MNHVAGPSNHVARLAVQRVTPPAPRPPAVPDPSAPSYEELRRRAEKAQADEAVALRRTEAAPIGVEPVSTQAVLHLRQTSAPVGHIADAYGLSPSAVQRMLRSTAPSGADGPSA